MSMENGSSHLIGVQSERNAGLFSFFPIRQAIAEASLQRISSGYMTDARRAHRRYDLQIKNEQNVGIANSIYEAYRVFQETCPENADSYAMGMYAGYDIMRRTAKLKKEIVPMLNDDIIETALIDYEGGVEYFCLPVNDLSQRERRAAIFFDQEKGLSQAIAAVYLLGMKSDELEVLGALKQGLHFVASIFQTYEDISKLKKMFISS